MKTFKIKSKHGIFKVLIDDEDYEIIIKLGGWNISKGRRNDDIKIKRTFKNKVQYLHRFLLNLNPGDKKIVDHIDGNGLNNQKTNLRLCSSKENTRNQKRNNNNKSGYKGVVLNKKGTYTAIIGINGKCTYIKSFKTSIEAAKAYDKAAIKYFGEFASLNFPEDKVNETK